MNLLSDSFVKKRYVSAGSDFGDAASYSYMGESGNIKFLLNRWSRWEQE